MRRNDHGNQNSYGEVFLRIRDLQSPRRGKIFWTADGVGAKVAFDLYTAWGTAVAAISTDLIPGCNPGCSGKTSRISLQWEK